MYVEARRAWSADRVLDDYRSVSPEAITRLADLGTQTFELPLGDLGTYPASALANAFAFDHYTHIRIDLFAPRGPLAAEPDNIDMLMAIAEYHFARDDAREKVIIMVAHAIDVLDKKTRPASLTDEDWAKKKSTLLGNGYYMGGISSSLIGQYGRADQMLRAALPMIVNDGNQEATSLYHLGVANYHLADRDPMRAQEALRFWRRCAT